MVKDLLSINLSWIDDNRLYEIIRKDVYDMLKKGNMSHELSYIAHFKDDIENEYIKNKKKAWEKLNVCKKRC